MLKKVQENKKKQIEKARMQREEEGAGLEKDNEEYSSLVLQKDEDLIF